jgi:predicted metallo-beta-lactamase superfamily hydrolase
MFQRFCKKVSKEQHVADGARFEFGETVVRFSGPIVHGEEESGLGWVLACIVEHGSEKFIHAPDVQGPMASATMQFLSSERPNVLILGGPPLYLVDAKVARSSFDRGMNNMAELAKVIPTIVLDHHLLRSLEWRDAARTILEVAASQGHRVVTAAEFVGENDTLLEASRRELYEKNPPSKAFLAWTKMKPEKRRKKTPPLR